MADLLTRDLRLLVLRLVNEVGPGYNDSVLYKAVGQKGHPCTRDQFHAAVNHLVSLGALKKTPIPNPPPQYTLALLEPGLDHLEFRGPALPGVDRPSSRHD